MTCCVGKSARFGGNFGILLAFSFTASCILMHMRAARRPNRPVSPNCPCLFTSSSAGTHPGRHLPLPNSYLEGKCNLALWRQRCLFAQVAKKIAGLFSNVLDNGLCLCYDDFGRSAILMLPHFPRSCYWFSLIVSCTVLVLRCLRLPYLQAVSCVPLLAQKVTC
jgi:hypothetical protein